MISVGIPIYKTEFLRDAISSVLDQRYGDLELLLLNSYGSREVHEIVELFKDERIRYIEDDTHPSIVENWNRVLSYARGEYFVLFSDDDIYDPDFLGEMHRLTGVYPQCDVFHCRVRRVDESGRQLSLSPLCPEHESGLEFIAGRLTGGRIQFAPDFMSRTDSLRAVGGFMDLPLAWGSDDITWMKLALGKGIAYSQRPLVSWRVSDSQVSRAGDLNARLEAVDIYREWMRGFLREYSPKDETEKKLIIGLEAGSGKAFSRQKHYLFNVAAETGDLKDIMRLYRENRRKHGLRSTWLARAVLNKLLNRKMV
jgi:glycosyltransferase involved in cell wall biosynthesis